MTSPETVVQIDAIHQKAVRERLEEIRKKNLADMPTWPWRDFGFLLDQLDARDEQIARLRAALVGSCYEVPVGSLCRYIAFPPADWHDGWGTPTAAFDRWDEASIDRAQYGVEDSVALREKETNG